MIHILDPRLLLAFLLVFGAAALGFHFEGRAAQRKDDDSKLLKGVSDARETESELQRINSRATSAYIDHIRKQEEKAHALPKIVLPVNCAIPAAVGSVLNDAQRSVREDAGSGSNSGTASTAVDSACAAELEIAKRNYAEVCVPNADQLTELQERWDITQKKVNKGQP
ncbi:hypothetical protein [Herminiimonas sp. CN]|uniref:hypothetical protein n=1 Tax=Herminiimonas sp. CN TaxID=1349818 RepID=UPI000473C5E9|nr:hypothetical protein [Herminiimonas sp. CN]